MGRSLRAMLIAGAFALCAASAALANAPAAQMAGGCSVGEGHGYGYSYLTSLHTRRISCNGARTVVRHHGHMRGWRCQFKRLDTSPVQYDSRATCTSRGRQIVWTYTQNT
ncbi:MAG: hypothetical protein ACRDMX_03055 [Solirubrobacteraceae bacterium]